MSFGTVLVLLLLALSVFASENEFSRTGDYPENKAAKTTETKLQISTTDLEGNKKVHKYLYTAHQTVMYHSVNYSVYKVDPPAYVYEIRNSGSKFDNLLTGLALYNLGKASQSNGVHKEYVAGPNETCWFEVRTKDGKFERLAVDCKLISAFIMEKRATEKSSPSLSTTTTTLIPVSATTPNSIIKILTATKNGNSTEVKATVVDALKILGPSIAVTNDTSCVIINLVAGNIRLRENVDCGLLEAYSISSFHTSDGTNAATRISILYALVIAPIAICIKSNLPLHVY